MVDVVFTFRTCVNGSVIREKRRVKHGDRILWGNNHFFRLNCPRLANSKCCSSLHRGDMEMDRQTDTKTERQRGGGDGKR